jgi:molybdate transport system substrate-binding protein
MSNNSGGGPAIKVLCAGAMSEIVRELGRAFEVTAGIPVAAEFTRSAAVAERVRGGDAVDVVIATQAAIEDLVSVKKIVPESAAMVARSGIGVAVQAGRPKPDIGSVEAFKSALRNAKSVAYADPATGSPSANYLVGLFDRLGLTAALQSKAKLIGAVGGHAVVVCVAVARGEAEIGIQQISEIVPVKGVDFVGPVPAEIQHMTVFSAAVASAAANVESARHFIRFMTSDAAEPAIAAQGMEPIRSGGVS